MGLFHVKLYIRPIVVSIFLSRYSLVANHFYLLTSNLKNYLMKKPFIDFYNKYNIIPTSQNVKDVKSFLYQRNHLYSNLGIPLSFFSNKNIIEFGPGGGW